MKNLILLLVIICCTFSCRKNKEDISVTEITMQAKLSKQSQFWVVTLSTDTLANYKAVVYVEWHTYSMKVETDPKTGQISYNLVQADVQHTVLGYDGLLGGKQKHVTDQLAFNENGILYISSSYAKIKAATTDNKHIAIK